MKKRINSVNSWSVKGIITVTILSAMLCTFSAKAYNKPSAAVKAVNEAVKSESGVESLMNNDFKANYEAEQYNAGEFVEADMALETENWMSTNAETNYEPVLQVEYNAKEFVDAELALETESWMNQNGL